MFESLESRRLLSAGSFDGTFGTGGRVTLGFSDSGASLNDTANAVITSPDGHIYVAGYSEPKDPEAANGADFSITRVDADGLNPIQARVDFNGLVDIPQAMALQDNGKIIVVGMAQNVDPTQASFGVVRLNADLTLDSTFGAGGKVTYYFSRTQSTSGEPLVNQATSVIIDPNDKILVVGYSMTSGGSLQLAAVRFKSNGFVDSSFNTNGLIDLGLSPATHAVRAPDGGYYLRQASATQLTVLKLTSTGAVDTTFGTNGVAGLGVAGYSDIMGTSMLLQPDGKVVVCGVADQVVPGTSGIMMARFNADGSADTTFGGTGIKLLGPALGLTDNTATVFSMALQSNGKFLIAGTEYNGGTNLSFTARLTANGQLDPSWWVSGTTITDVPGTTHLGSDSVTLDGQGRLVVAGTAHNTAGDNNDFFIARYWTSGRDAVGIFRNGQWGIDSDGNRGWNAGSDSTFALGQAGDIPVSGDWLGDGISHAGIFRDGQWVLDTNGTAGFQSDDTLMTFGGAGMTPLVGDWDGDGYDDIGVFVSGQWALDNDGIRGWTPGDEMVAFGSAGMTPLVGDWNGDNRSDIGVFSNGQWALDSDAALGWTAGDESFAYGAAGMMPVIGDWNGIGRSDIGVFLDGQWALDSDGVRGWSGGDAVLAFGSAGWAPVVGDWNDDGKTDIGVFTGARWGLDADGIRGWTVGDASFAFGLSADKPIIGRW